MCRWLCFLSTLCVLLAAFAVHGQTAAMPYAWDSGDLSLMLPPGWTVTSDRPALELASGTMRLTVTTAPRDFAALEPLVPLQEALTASGYVLLDYAPETVYGLPGIQANIATSARALTGRALAGWTPDGRALILMGAAAPTDRPAWDQAFSDVLASLTFSASSPPAPRLYRPIWRSDVGIVPTDNRVGAIALTVSNERVYAVAPGRGLITLAAEDGSLIDESNFPNPAQPTDIAAAQDIIYIADSVCRCLLRRHADGTWLDPVGAFGPNAPLRLAARPDGVLVALDTVSGGYALQILSATTDRTTIPLQFNAAAPPLMALSADGEIMLIEWLTSLLDSSVSGALFSVTSSERELVRWLPVTPEQVRDVTTLPDGKILFALADGTLAIERSGGQMEALLTAESSVRRLTSDASGTIYALLDSGRIVAYSNRGDPDRTGHPVLIPGVPVVGSLNEAQPMQQWQYQGTAGERITLNAIDPGIQIGLDVALRLFAPGGRELAYNDDHLGPDLPGIYDAQIREFILPETGTYTIQAEWVQFSGSYVLLVARDRTFGLQADMPITLRGRILDAQPVERWVFNGSMGTSLTVTMSALSGTLDPTLELIDPYGMTLAYNDDGRDPELGTNAQLFRVTLPMDGQYVIEASRYAGSGDYEIIVLTNG